MFRLVFFTPIVNTENVKPEANMAASIMSPIFANGVPCKIESMLLKRFDLSIN